jgi:hypothetical protein
MSRLDKDVVNDHIKMDLEVSNLETKARLMKEALDGRNDELHEIEDNNRQLLSLLEKYDAKLDEM